MKVRIAFLTAVLLFLLAVIVSSQTAPKNAPTLSSQELFKRVSPSVLIVEALDSEGEVTGSGSGVAIGRDEVVTNKHVIDAGISIRVRQGKKTWAATITHIDADHDLCKLEVKGLQATPVKLRMSKDLQVGDRAYAIGAPEGLELTLSEGIISGLRDYGKVRLIQTTAAISPGSSGGGLFDTEGKLVGITTFYLLEGQNLNFALPGEWVLTLDSHPVSAQRGLGVSEYQAFLWYASGVMASDKGEYADAVRAYLRSIRLESRNAATWYNLGNVYGELGQYQEAIEAYEEAIRLSPDQSDAWNNLGFAYANQGQHQKALEAHREAIRLDPNNFRAWVNLGVRYGRLGQHQQAIHAFQEAIRLNPEDATIWFPLGLVYNHQGNRTKVFEVYRRLRELDADLADRFFREIVLP